MCTFRSEQGGEQEVKTSDHVLNMPLEAGSDRQAFRDAFVQVQWDAVQWDAVQ